MALIYHISGRDEWEQAKNGPTYRDESLEKEGFIHCSRAEQVHVAANRYYHGRQDLVLMEIDEAKLIPEVRYEALVGAEAYPHIYGPLNIDAVVSVIDFPPQADGSFVFPAAPANG